MAPKKQQVAEKWVGKTVNIVLDNGEEVAGTIERIEQQQVFVKEADGRKTLCFNMKKISDIVEV
jgi:ribosome maturation factor RimP